jgi:hypothetical protein
MLSIWLVANQKWQSDPSLRSLMMATKSERNGEGQERTGKSACATKNDEGRKNWPICLTLLEI